MRDDIACVFSSIQIFQEKKIQLLTDIKNREFELKYLLEARNEEGILELQEKENRLIEEIDICDYEISTKLDHIKFITGIDPLNPVTTSQINNEVIFNEFIKKTELIEMLIYEIKSLKTGNLNLMKSIADETVRSGDELNRIDRVKKRFAKDLQSS